MNAEPLSVVKLGGSLLDMPGVWAKLRRWLDALPGRHFLLIGGGAIADLIRRIDTVHRLGNEEAHWWALRAMGFNARLASRLLPRAKIVAQPSEFDSLWKDRQTPIIEPIAFLIDDILEPDPLPYTWDVTSDSITARIARQANASHLYLLKSRSAPHFQTWEEFAEAGIVDKWFPNEARALPSTEIVLINFRELR